MFLLLADNKEVRDRAFKNVIPIISQQKLCDPRRPHLFHTLPHPGPRRVLGGGGVPPRAGHGNSGPRISEDRRGIRPHVDEDVEAIAGNGIASSDQGRERQIVLLYREHPAAHLANGEPHGGVDESMDGRFGEERVEGARSRESEKVRVGAGEEGGGFREAAEVAGPPEEAAAGGGVGPRGGLEEGGGGRGSARGDGAVADEHRRRRRRHAEENEGSYRPRPIQNKYGL